MKWLKENWREIGAAFTGLPWCLPTSKSRLAFRATLTRDDAPPHPVITPTAGLAADK